MNTDTLDTEKTLTTADFASAGERKAEREIVRDNRDAALERQPGEDMRDGRAADEPLAALFPTEIAGDFQSRWDAVQIGFVDDPRQAVQRADELVAQVMKNLAESFANERQRFDEQMNAANGSASTEDMRVALRRYRSFFQRLLSL